MKLEIKVIEEKDNPLLNRREILKGGPGLCGQAED